MSKFEYMYNASGLAQFPEWSISEQRLNTLKKQQLETLSSLKCPVLAQIAKFAFASEKDMKMNNLDAILNLIQKWTAQDSDSKKMNKISQILTLRSSKLNGIKGTFRFLVNFSRKTLFIAGTLTFQTQYQVVVNAFSLFYDAYDARKDFENRISKKFDRIHDLLRDMSFARSVIKSPVMMVATTKLLTAVVCFIDGMVIYLRRPVITRATIYFGTGYTQYDELFNDITEAVNEVKDAKRNSHLAMTADSLTMLKSIHQHQVMRHIHQLCGHLFEKPYTNLIDVASNHYERRYLPRNQHWPRQFKIPHTKSQLIKHNAISKSSENETFPSSDTQGTSEAKMTLLHRFGNKVGKVVDILDRSGIRGSKARDSSLIKQTKAFDEEILDASSQSAMVALTAYNEPVKPVPLTWITGSVTKHGVSWVSSLSVDLYNHTKRLGSTQAVLILCKRAKGESYNSAFLIKSIIYQILNLFPVVFANNLHSLPTRLFESIPCHKQPGSAQKSWDLLCQILKSIENSTHLNNKRIMIIIDRLDLCKSASDFSVLYQLIPKLQLLSHRFMNTHVIITTGNISAAKVTTLRQDDEYLKVSYSKCASISPWTTQKQKKKKKKHQAQLQAMEIDRLESQVTTQRRWILQCILELPRAERMKIRMRWLGGLKWELKWSLQERLEGRLQLQERLQLQKRLKELLHDMLQNLLRVRL